MITGFSFFRFLQPKNGKVSTQKVSCRELFEAAQEYQVRELCFWVCVNMVANAIGRCELRTFRGGEEIRERDYYLWNVSPNVNQNSTAFWHKLVARLYQDNEALIVPTLTRPDGMDALVVADDWAEPEEWPSRQNEYRSVRCGEYTWQYPFYESGVLHLKLHHKNNAFLYLDISGLRPAVWKVEQVTAPAASTNAELSGLKIGALTLSPEFAGATTAYTATTTNATNVITAIPADAGAEIEILVDPPVAESYEIDNGTAVTWETGETTVTINVTAADGSSKKAYTVTVTKS